MTDDKTKGSVVVKRVTLPRYEVRYEKFQSALEQARTIKDSRGFVLDYTISEPIGQEVVLDLGVEGATAVATLLFRVIQRLDDQTVLEWWARRRTDPDLLEMWIEWLEQNIQPGKGSGKTSLAPAEIFGMLELCRRSLAGNPFIALGVHWTCTAEEIQKAFDDSMTRLLTFKNKRGSGERAGELLTKARDGLQQAGEMLSTLEKRHSQRRKFIPVAHLDQARELARTKAQVARLRKDNKEYQRAIAELKELEC